MMNSDFKGGKAQTFSTLYTSLYSSLESITKSGCELSHRCILGNKGVVIPPDQLNESA